AAVALTVGEASLVILWLFEVPVSLVSVTVGVGGGMVSSVKLKLAALPVLPATSICRTCTLLAPSTALKLLLHVEPPLMLYCTLAPLSTPLTFSAPLRVIWSLLELPVSLLSATVGAAGAVVSRVKLKLVAWPVLDGTSVGCGWRV